MAEPVLNVVGEVVLRALSDADDVRACSVQTAHKLTLVVGERGFDKYDVHTTRLVFSIGIMLSARQTVEQIDVDLPLFFPRVIHGHAISHQLTPGGLFLV